jgi:hypothetical protein
LRRNLVVLAAMIVVVLFFTPHNAGAQCPEDENDLGTCDTLYVETFDCDHEYQAALGSFDSVRVAIYVTHDSNTFLWASQDRWVQDSIAAFVIPLTFWDNGCADSVILPEWNYWNNTDCSPYSPLMNRSIFRDIVDEHTGDTVYNRMLWLASQFEDLEWSTRILDIEPHSSDGDSGHAWLSMVVTSPTNRRWWEGSRVLLATLTFHVYMSEDCDTTQICLDSTLWWPSSHLVFARHDAVVYSPRHFLPVCDTIYTLRQPPEITCPDPETQHTNGSFTTTTKWYAFDPDSALADPPLTCQAPGGPIPSCNVNVEWSTPGSAEGTIEYSVTDHGQTGTYYIMLTVMDNQEMADTCFLPITLENHPPVLDAIGNQKFNEGDYVVLNVSAFDLDGDSLIFTASNLPDGADFYGGDGVFLWTPTYTQRGTYPNIHFEVSDGQGGVDSEDITIEILNYPQGDVTDDGIVNVADVVYLVTYLFLGGPPPDTMVGNVNCDLVVNVADVVYLVTYLFQNGPAACAPPSPRFILPEYKGSVNGLVWVSVENLSDTPVQDVWFDYSADGVVWNELVFDEREPPGSPGCYDLTGRTYQGSWNTDDLESGDYWLRVTTRDTVHSLEDSEITSVMIDKNPIPLCDVSYDPSTGTVFFDASSSYDPEGSVIWWEWLFCDTSTYQGPVIQKTFVPGVSCQVNLTVYDHKYKSTTSYNMLEVGETEVMWEEWQECVCLDLTVFDSGRIPRDSRLDFGRTRRPNPKGGKVLGPVDHHEKDAAGNNIPLGLAKIYYMVEASIIGNPECCSTMQYNNYTALYDGPGGPGPNGMKVTHSGGRPFDPANPNNPQNPPSNPADLDPDDYATACDCRRDPPTVALEKKSFRVPAAGGLLAGFIRWIDAPGVSSANLRSFSPSGVQVFDFKKFEVIDYPVCSGGCEKCIIWKAKYDKDGNRQDVTGNGTPDPPTITDPDADCPQ